MQPTVKQARIAGLLYLLMAVPAPFGLIYVPATLIVRNDAAATAHNILASEMLFRAGIVANIASMIAFLLAAIALYRLFRGINEAMAATMVTLVGVSVAIGVLNELNNVAALLIFNAPHFLSSFTGSQLQALGMLFLGMHKQGVFINQMFWGLWLFPFGLLTIRSRFIPRIFGVLLLINGAMYVVLSLTALLMPAWYATVDRYSFVALLGEIWIMLWLLTVGVRPQQRAALA